MGSDNDRRAVARLASLGVATERQSRLDQLFERRDPQVVKPAISRCANSS